MSMMTHVLVMGPSKDAMERVNAWLTENDKARGQQFTKIDFEQAGGSKFWCPDVWAACFNYMPWDLRSILRDPKTWGVGMLSVAVVIDGEDDMSATLFESWGNYREPKHGSATIQRDSGRIQLGLFSDEENLAPST